MELSSSHEEVEIPVPINSAFVGIHNNMHVQHGDAHMIHHHHHSHDPSSSSTHNNNHNHNKIIPSNNNNSSNGTNSTITAPLPILEEEKEDDDDGNMYDDDDDDDGDGKLMVKKKKIKYKECQKNHAASIGGNARDGCGEFMASGEEGSLEYLICSACNCHRNFHRKHVIQGGVGYNNNNKNNNNNENYYLMMQSQFYPSNNTTTTTPHLLGSRGRKVILGTEGARAVGPPRVPFSRSVEVNMPYTLLSDRYDDHHHGNDGGGMMMMMHHHHKNNDDDNNKNKKGVVKKRFRTKFSQEQKEKMYEFAEKVGWKIQKQEESVVQQFCQQIGIRRRVLKVWMHNNKHNNMAKIKNHHNHIININNNNSSS